MRLVLLLLALSLCGAAQARGNAANGKALAAKTCVACHGADGAFDGKAPISADQPIIAGQHYDYLVKALSDYKSGKRNNPIMKGFATPLSKQDIEDLSAWFASQKSKLHTER